MKVAVYTIAKNEEQFVDRWAESAKDADLLLIADTGSTDETKKRARKAGVKVIDVSINPWRFDDARNAALARIPADFDYCIALDMDEVLVPGWRAHLEEAVKGGLTRPRYKYTWSWEDEAETKPGLVYGGDKIHARKGYRWKHPVHEVIVADRIEEIQGWVDLEIHHHPDHTKSRGQYFPLLELAVQEDPQDDRNSHYLAREYFYNRMYDKARVEFERHLSLPKAIWPAERAASMRYLAKIENREFWLKRAIQESPGRREALVELADFYYQKNDWLNCYRNAKAALKVKEKPLDYLCENFAWGPLPFDLAALSAFYLEKYSEAVDFGKKALELEPSDERLQKNLDCYRGAIHV
jgi:glycosyltransferase involved in cell wall biosynthesis